MIEAGKGRGCSTSTARFVGRFDEIDHAGCEQLVALFVNTTNDIQDRGK